LDSLTHTVLGACMGEAIAGKKLGKQAMLWGALANNIPDIDVVSSAWMTQVDSLLAHRGITHSFLFCLIFPLILAFVFARINKRLSLREWYLMFASGMIVHILIDALTCYGTGWFEPFSKSRVSLNVLFVADPFYTLPLLVGFFALIFMSMKSRKRKLWTRIALFTSTAYIFYAIVNKISINSIFRNQLKEQQISCNDWFSTPTPLNNFLWMLVARTDSGFYIGYRSVFDNDRHIDFHYRPCNDKLLANLPQDRDLINLKRFSKNFYVIEKHNDSLYFNDIRFGSVRGWDNPDADFVFRYALDKNANNDLVIQRGRLKVSGGEAVRSLFNRIKGNVTPLDKNNLK
jgi:inner membrane protein